MIAHVGPGTISRLEAVLSGLGARRVLVVAGPRTWEATRERIRGALTGLEVDRHSAFQANPTVADVDAAAASALRHRADAILAVGGGSALDVAKLASVVHASGGTAEEYAGGTRAPAAATPVVAVPTTAGSGAEATHFAVVYLGGRKRSVAHPALRPAAAIVDARLADGLPAPITAASGMDALAQGIESAWNVHATSASTKDAHEAIRLAWLSLPGAVRDERSARDGMAFAAHLAGRAIDVTKTTAPHAVSYPLTAHHGVPHGHAVALTLGAFLEWNAAAPPDEVLDPAGPAAHAAKIRGILEVLGFADAQSARRAIEARLAGVGLATRLGSVGAGDDASIDRVLANVDPDRMSNNPRRTSVDSIRGILRSIR